VLFSDLMAAANPPQESESKSSLATPGTSPNADPASKEDADQVDQDLAALAAATQIATRGVTVKPSNTTTATPSTGPAALQAIASGEATATSDLVLETDAEHGSTEEEDDKLRAPQEQPLIDGAELNVQALINLVMTTTIAQPKDQPAPANGTDAAAAHDLADTTEHQILDYMVASAQVEAQESSHLQSPAISDTPSAWQNGSPHDAVGFPTVSDEAAAVTDAADSPHQPEVQAPKIAALQGIAWFDGAPQVTNSTNDDGAPSDATIQDASSNVAKAPADLADASADMQAAAMAQSGAPDPSSIASTQPVAQVPDQVQEEQLDAATAADGNPTDAEKHGNDEADALNALAPTPVPMQTIIPQAQQLSAEAEFANADDDTTASYTTRNASDPYVTHRAGSASSDTQAFNLTAGGSKTENPSEPYQSVESAAHNMGAANPAEVNGSLSTTRQHLSVGEPGEAPGKVPTTPETVIEADLSQGKTEWTPNKNSTRETDRRLADVAEHKALEDNDQTPKIEPVGKADVNIREILKLGATDVALSFQTPDVPATTQLATEKPLAAQANSTQQVSPQQAAPIATTNVETNEERRTIADDIRLRVLERMVVNAARNGTQILSIQLYPPGLGQVVLRLAMDGQRLRLATRAATTEAADTLRNMEADLRDALAGNGLQLAGFDVSEDGNNDEAPRRQSVEPLVKTRGGGTKESFIVDLNA
jgi:hypothetical protein